MRALRSPAILATAATLLVGCAAAGPDDEPPAASLPAAWRDAGAAGLPPREADTASWWRRLGDPVLDGLVARATQVGPDLREALARVREARALRGASRADRFPTLDGVLSYERRGESENTVFGRFVPDSELYAAGFDASWEVDLWGRVRRAAEAADADFEATVEDARDVAVSVAAETAARYVELRAFQRRLAIALTQLDLQEQTAALVRARFESGLVGERDLAQANALVQSTRARVPALEIGVRAAENRLAVLLGVAPGALESDLVRPAPIPVPPPEVAVGVPADLLRRRADVRRAERVLAAEHARTGAARAELYPRLTLRGNLGLAADTPSGLFDAGSDTYGIGPSIRWNLFDAGRIRRRVEARDARAEQARVRWERTVLAALEETENAMTAFVHEQRRRRSLLEAGTESRRAVELARRQYEEGLTDFQAVLDSERTLADLEDGATESEAAVATNLIRLFKALGGGWEREDDAGAPAAP